MTLARNRFGFYLSPVPFRKYLNTHSVVFDQDAFLDKFLQVLLGLVIDRLGMDIDIRCQIDLGLGDMKKGMRIIGSFFPRLVTVQDIIRSGGDLAG